MFLYALNKHERLYRGLLSIKKPDAICLKSDILYTRPTKQLLNTPTEGKKMHNPQKEAQTKLMKGLLDLVVLQFLSQEPMHGYQIITRIRRSFGIYFGPSTIYPLLGTLEKKGYVNSVWNMESERPRKIYKLTNDGQNLLSFTEDSLNLICRRINLNSSTEVTVNSEPRTTIRPLLKRM